MGTYHREYDAAGGPREYTLETRQNSLCTVRHDPDPIGNTMETHTKKNASDIA